MTSTFSSLSIQLLGLNVLKFIDVKVGDYYADTDWSTAGVEIVSFGGLVEGVEALGELACSLNSAVDSVVSVVVVATSIGLLFCSAAGVTGTFVSSLVITR